MAGIAVFALAGLGCSALLPLTISFGEGDLTAMAAAMAGGVIAFYQLGYGIAAFGVGPLQDGGVSLSVIFGFTAIIAATMALLSFRHRPACTGRTCRRARSVCPAERILPQGMMCRVSSGRTLTPVTVRRPRGGSDDND